MSTLKIKDLQVEEVFSGADKLDSEHVGSLKKSIDSFGLVDPITVFPRRVTHPKTKKRSRQYFVIAGHHRLEALRQLVAEGKKKYIECEVSFFTGTEEQARLAGLGTNVARRTFSSAQIAEKALGFKSGGIKMAEIAASTGLSLVRLRAIVSDYEKALPEVRQAAVKGDISMSTLGSIAKAKNENKQKEALAAATEAKAAEQDKGQKGHHQKRAQRKAAAKAAGTAPLRPGKKSIVAGMETIADMGKATKFAKGFALALNCCLGHQDVEKIAKQIAKGKEPTPKT